MPPKKTTPAKPDLTHLLEEIKERAHAIYLERAARGQGGDELSDWLKAEGEIKKKYGIK